MASMDFPTPVVPVYHEEAERAILSKLIPMVRENARVIVIESRKRSRVCYAWEAGTCTFGDKCKFAHENTGHESMEDKGKRIMNQLQALRAVPNPLMMKAGVKQLYRDISEESGMAINRSIEHEATSEAIDASVVIDTEIPNVDSLRASLANYESELTESFMIRKYYSQLYLIDGPSRFSGSSDLLGGIYRTFDQYVHLHSNRICLIGLAPSHPIVRHKLLIKQVQFNNTSIANSSNAKTVVADVNVKGKGKKGSVFLEPNWIVATITTLSATADDGSASETVWPVFSSIRGSIIEINKSLLDHPQNITKYPESSGHIAVMDIHMSRVFDMRNSLLDRLEYAELCKLRNIPCNIEDV
jgi:Zinc finger C-x8-C-x5-C-x3-H type (and similar)